MKREAIMALLREKGFRATEGRVALIEALSKRPSPEPIEKIAVSVSRTLDAANVYRALLAFTKAGIVRTIDFRDGKTYYELASDRHHHHHVVCTDCGKIEDVHGCIPALEKKVLAQSRSFSMIDSHSLEFFGMCKACAGKS
jgi:Fur family ferric uptake transcriptional regulator